MDFKSEAMPYLYTAYEKSLLSRVTDGHCKDNRRNVKSGDCISDLEINMGYDQYVTNRARKILKSL